MQCYNFVQVVQGSRAIRNRELQSKSHHSKDGDNTIKDARR